jgi:hypothetical protein
VGLDHGAGSNSWAWIQAAGITDAAAWYAWLAGTRSGKRVAKFKRLLVHKFMTGTAALASI